MNWILVDDEGWAVVDFLSSVVSWWIELGVAVKASVVLAFWKSVELLWGGGKGLWNYWRERRDKDLQERYPQLYDRLSVEDRWMLRDRADFPRVHLFARLISEEIEERRMDKMDFKLETHGRESKRLDVEELRGWMMERNEALKGMAETVRKIAGGAGELLSGAVGGDGGRAVRGDARVVARLAERGGELYERAIRMGIEAQQIEARDERFQGVVDAYSDAVYSIIEGVEEIADLSAEVGDEMVDEYCSGRNFPLSVIPRHAYIRLNAFMTDVGLRDGGGKELSVEKSFEMSSEPIERINRELAEVLEELE